MIGSSVFKLNSRLIDNDFPTSIDDVIYNYNYWLYESDIEDGGNCCLKDDQGAVMVMMTKFIIGLTYHFSFSCVLSTFIDKEYSHLALWLKPVRRTFCCSVGEDACVQTPDAVGQSLRN